MGARGGHVRVAQQGGAPSFTVGGRHGSAMMGGVGGEQDFHDQEIVGLRRADLLRRILHAMRCVCVRAVCIELCRRPAGPTIGRPRELCYKKNYNNTSMICLRRESKVPGILLDKQSTSSLLG